MKKHFFRSLEIENFRGIRTSRIDNFARVNLFVGENSCGKTTILESLFLLAAIRDPSRMVNIQNSRGIYLTEPRDLADFFFEQKHENNLRLTGTHESGKRELTINALYRDSRASRTDSQQENGSGNNHILKVNNMDSKTDDCLLGLGYTFSVSCNGDGGPDQHNSKVVATWSGSPVERARFETYIDEKYKEKSLNSVAVIRGSKDSYEHLPVDGIGKMLQEKRKDILLESLQKIDPRIQDIQVSTAGVVLADIGVKSFIPLNLLGDGLLHMVNLVSHVDDTRGGILMIDEFGSGFHVSCVEYIWKVLIEQSGKYDTQVFMTTHSKDVVEGLAGLHGREPDLFSEDGDDVACFYLGKNSEGRVKGYRYSPEDIKQVLKSDTDIRH